MSIFRSIKRSLQQVASSWKKVFIKFREGPTTQDLTKKMVLSVVKTRAFPSSKQWKHLPQVLGQAERRVASFALTTIVLSLLFLGGRYVFVHQEIVPAIGGEYTEGLIGTPQFVNPLYASVSDVDADLTRLVFSGLMKYDPIDGLVPDLAESYDISDDGKTYTFVLRANTKWHDGDPVTVSDVVSTFSIFQNADYKSPLSVSFKDVSVVEVDERTVQFVLNDPFAPFLSALTVGILPGQIWDFIPPKNAPLAEANLRPIGSGPYQFDKFNKDRVGNIRSYSLTRNPNYYGAPAKIARLTFRFYPDPTSALDALEKKVTEGISFIPAEQIKKAESNHGVRILRPYLPQVTALFFNEVKNPALKDVSVRKALAMAIDRNALIQNGLAGYGRTIESPFFPGMIGYNDTITQPAYDVSGAKALIDAVKAKMPVDAQTIALTLTTIDNTEFQTTAAAIKTAWEAIGVTVTLRTVNVNALPSEILKERDYDVLLSGELLGIDPDPYPFWHSSQVDYPGLNIALYSNRKADTLIAEGRTTTDPVVRAEKYLEFQQLLLEDVPAIFLYQPTYAYAVSGAIKGIDLPSIMSPSDRFANITEWYVKTTRVLR